MNVTTDNIAELVNTTQKHPLLVKWKYDGSIDIFPAATFHHGNPLGAADNKTAHDILADRDDIFRMIGKPFQDMNNADFQKAADLLNT